jgi:hypothetical protein
MPRYLAAGAVALALWTAIGSGRVLTGILPATLVVVVTPLDVTRWYRRRRPWHDWPSILPLLGPIVAAVWIAVGGLVMGVERGEAGRLLLEVGPGVALTGLLCSLIAYLGRHHPDPAIDGRVPGPG